MVTMTDESLKTFLDERWKELPDDVRLEAVALLRGQFSTRHRQYIRSRYAVDPTRWITPLHFGWGMAVRNFLREHGLADDRLPSGNWDDYYVQCVEAAAGLRV